jgi:hypothetical protein
MSGGKHLRANPLRTRTTECFVVLSGIPVDMIATKTEKAINIAACTGISESDLASPGSRAPVWEATLWALRRPEISV